MNNFILHKITLSKFLENRLHIGHNLKNLHSKMNSYVFGIRHKIIIFNIEKFIFSFKSLYYNIINFFFLRTSFFILGINDNFKLDFILNRFFNFFKMNALNIYFKGYVTEKWISGLLSNWTVYFNLLKFIKLKILKNSKLSTKYLKYYNYLKCLNKKNIKPIFPDFILLFNYDKNALNEIISLKIPFFGIVDSKSNPNFYLYHFFGNDNSIDNFNFFFNFLKESFLNGRFKEKEFFFFLIMKKLKEKIVLSKKLIFLKQNKNYNFKFKLKLYNIKQKKKIKFLKKFKIK